MQEKLLSGAAGAGNPAKTHAPKTAGKR